MGRGRARAGAGRARRAPRPGDRAIGAWLVRQQPPPPASPPPPHRPQRAVAVDGKTLRGSGHYAAPVHLLAAMDHTTAAVLAQTDVDHTTNEITQFRPLLERVDLAGQVITADALHTQRQHAEWLVSEKHADYLLLLVKHNQPARHRQLATVPWHQVPVADLTRDRGHGRVETRQLQVATVVGLDFPHATQALPITRRVRPLGSRRPALQRPRRHPSPALTGHHKPVARQSATLPRPWGQVADHRPAARPAVCFTRTRFNSNAST
jgi:predicted transposase YbfD/YdcC